MDDNTKKILNEKAAEIQPDALFEEGAKNMSEDGKQLYLSMISLYKVLCEKEISFTLLFTTRDNYKSYLFYRLDDLNNLDSYQKVANSQFDEMYRYLQWVGYIKHLEEREYIKILPKGEHKTFKEQNNL